MRVLVTGSSGRIGSQVVSRLIDRGHQVRGFDLRPSGLEVEGFEEILGSLDDRNGAQAAVDGVDTILHLGAFMSWAPSDRDKMFSSNVDGTHVLLDTASKAGAKRFVFASSGEVYPENAPKRLPITEAHPLNPNSDYGLTKLLGEELVRFHQRTGPMETVILRFSHTQDADELLDENSVFSGPRFFLRPRIRQQETFGNHEVAELLRSRDLGYPSHILCRNARGRPYQMHITDTRDMVDGVLLVMSHPDAAGEVFNLGATDPVEFAPLLDAMSKITGSPVVPVDLPGDGVFYHTSNAHIRGTLGFSPQWTIAQMLDDAARARKERAGG